MGMKELVGNHGGSDEAQLIRGISSRVHGSVRKAVGLAWVFMPPYIVGMDEDSPRDVLGAGQNGGALGVGLGRLELKQRGP